jgi:ubiquinone/menaquinone biosynthesis C-methylase UbiE
VSGYLNIQPSGRDTGAPRNLQKRLKLVQRHLTIAGTRAIDCGCGTGQYVLAMIALGGDAYGIEYSEEKVTQFKRQHPDLEERVTVGNLEEMAFDDSSFGVALLNDVLEHVTNEDRVLSEIHRIVEPGGKLILFSPNRLYPFETHGISLKRSKREIPYYVPFVPYVPLNLGNRVFCYHARNYWPNELQQMVTIHGFKVIHTSYLWQTFENISGRQPKVVTAFTPILRRLFATLETVPGLRIFGVTQVIIAQRR